MLFLKDRMPFWKECPQYCNMAIQDAMYRNQILRTFSISIKETARGKQKNVVRFSTLQMLWRKVSSWSTFLKNIVLLEFYCLTQNKNTAGFFFLNRRHADQCLPKFPPPSWESWFQETAWTKCSFLGNIFEKRFGTVFCLRLREQLPQSYAIGSHA